MTLFKNERDGKEVTLVLEYDAHHPREDGSMPVSLYLLPIHLDEETSFYEVEDKSVCIVSASENLDVHGSLELVRRVLVAMGFSVLVETVTND